MFVKDLAEKFGKLFLIGLPSTTLDDETKQVLECIKPGSVILFVRNIVSPEQVFNYVKDINSFLGYEPVISIDQEGGIVSRFRNGFSVAPGAMAVAATNKSQNAYETAFILGKEMRSCGIAWNLAPVVDINSLPTNPGTGVRSYGDTPEQVNEYAKEFIRGLHKAGVCSCLKHFPGLGRASVDPHHGRPKVSFTKAEFFAQELRPYIELQADSIMPSHAYYTGLQTKDEPASLSKEILLDLARKELGFSGLFVSDALGMGGVTISYTPVESAVTALAAGNDFLSFCHDSEEQMAVYKGALERIQESESLQKRVEESYERVNDFINYAQKGILKEKDVVQPMNLDSVGSVSHIQTMRKIILEGITHKKRGQVFSDCVKENENVIKDYTKDISAIFAVELTRQVEVEEGDDDDGIPFIAHTLSHMLNLPLYSFLVDPEDTEIEKLVKNLPQKGKVLIFTEDAILYPKQKKLVSLLCKTASDSLVVALRNPYDVWIESVGESFMTYGYERASQLALLDILTGKEKASGVFPLITSL